MRALSSDQADFPDQMFSVSSNFMQKMSPNLAWKAEKTVYSKVWS